AGGACGAGQRCSAGACVCDATTCPAGCCRGNQCQPGIALDACGLPGTTCGMCNATRADACVNGACQCGTGGLCATSQECVNGMCQCNGNTCAGCCRSDGTC